jgi:quercetin dioxygenase-like cupin family protein
VARGQALSPRALRPWRLTLSALRKPRSDFGRYPLHAVRRRLKLTALTLGVVISFSLLQGCGNDDPARVRAPSASPLSNSGDQAAAIERQALASVVDPAGAKGKTLSVSRVTVGARAVLDPHVHEGEQTSRIEKGTLTYTVIEGEVPVYRGSPEESRELVRRIRAGKTADIQPGEWVIEEASDVHAAENKGDTAVKIILTSLLRTGAPAATKRNEKTPKTGVE